MTVLAPHPVPVPPRPAGHTVRHCIPAVWMRSGTSKGLFIHKKHLPSSPSLWGPILLSIMGSSHGDKRQLDGLGGATSTTSKVVVIDRSRRPGVDVEYTFVQVAPDQAMVDMSGNCGNMAAGVGPFTLDEGLVHAAPGENEVNISIYNTNTRQTLVETVQVTPDGRFQEEGDYQVPGVLGTSSPIKMTFLCPGGSMTGNLLPTGHSQEVIRLEQRQFPPCEVRVSLVDAANPFVFVDAKTLPSVCSKSNYADETSLAVFESIRREAAVRFGLATDAASAGLTRGTPKIAAVFHSEQNGVDIRVLSFSMNKPHPSLQLTGAVCLGTALSIPGTVAWECRQRREAKTCLDCERHPETGTVLSGPTLWCIQHPCGQMTAEISLYMAKDGAVRVEQAAVYRTARRLFEGKVFYRE